MKKVFPLIAILFACQASIQAEDLKNTYVKGFESIPVFEFKKAEKEKGNNRLKFPPRTGHALIVTEIATLSAAAYAELEENDIIRSINGKSLRAPGDAESIFKSLKPHEEIKLGIIRRGKKKLEYLTLVIKPITKLEYQMRVLCSRKKNINGTIEVRHKYSPESVFARKNFQLYFTEKEGKPDTLYLRIAHLDSNYLFTKKFSVLTDANTYNIAKTFTKQEYATSLLNDINEINALGLFSKLNPVLRSRTRIIASKVDAGVKLKKLDILLLEEIGLGRKIVQNYKDGVEQNRETFIDIDDINRPHVLVGFGNYRLWEWYDEPLTKSQESMIKDMATSEKVTLRYHSPKYFKEYILAPEVREHLATVLRLFKANGGKLTE